MERKVVIACIDWLTEDYAIKLPLPSENQECFLEGLRVLFKQARFVPRKLCLDNLSAAVVKARSRGQETIFTDAFQRFASHYDLIHKLVTLEKEMKRAMWKIKWGMCVITFSPHPRLLRI